MSTYLKNIMFVDIQLLFWRTKREKPCTAGGGIGKKVF